ncbi:MAG TPA: hypothetical protein ENN89_00750 [Synergistetes bacterium]|nr:hypothetical protein [Synergistota bacterium]
MLFVIALPGFCDGALPRGKTIAVLVRSSSSQHARSAEAILINSLIQGGYKAVDKDRLESIRHNKAAALALEGDVDAILKLSQTYGFNVLVSGRATIHAPVKNEFGLYTATAVVSVSACQGADGRQLFADSSTAKEVGYTGDEAGQKALESAARMAARSMIDGTPSGGGSSAANASSLFEVEVSGIRSFAEAHAVVEALSKVGCGSSNLLRFAGGKAVVKASWVGNADSLAAALSRQRSDITLERVEGDRIVMIRR